jgi:hypothetical protein
VALPPLFSGIVFIRKTPILLGTLSLDLFAVLLGGATALLPIYAADILRTGPWGLGLLRSAPAVGALVMSVVLVRHPIERRVGPRLFGAGAGLRRRHRGVRASPTTCRCPWRRWRCWAAPTW